MATVSITSDLEPYLASLRTYLANDTDRRISSFASEDEDGEICTVNVKQTPDTNGEKKRKQGQKEDDGKVSKGGVGGKASRGGGLVR